MLNVFEDREFFVSPDFDVDLDDLMNIKDREVLDDL
jgi:hypothetical protein